MLTPIWINQVAVLMLLGFLASCFPTEQRPLYTCKACFKDNPNWCAVYEDGKGGFAEDEEQAKRFARIDLCIDVRKKTQRDDADDECLDRPMDDFLITCTSRMGKAPLHAGGCSRM
jgi:hypothetical protein